MNIKVAAFTVSEKSSNTDSVQNIRSDTMVGARIRQDNILKDFENASPRLNPLFHKT